MQFANSPDSSTPEAALETALEILRAGDFQTRWDAVKVISGFGEQAIAPLLNLVEEEETDWELLWFIARILGNLEHPTAVVALSNLLRTADNPEVAGMAATALANLGKAAIAPLSELLTDQSTRVLAVQALAQIRDPEVVPPLLETVEDASATVRATAIEALSHFYSPSISRVLLMALRDPAAPVRQAAVVGLGVQANQHDKPRLIADLKPLLSDLNLEVARQAAIALSRIGTSEAVAALFEALQSSYTATVLQIEIVRALGRIGDLSALNCLQQFFDLNTSQAPGSSLPVFPIDSLFVAREAVTVFGRLESADSKEKATEILLGLLQRQHPIAQDTKGKQAIALSLGQLGQPQAIEYLIQLLADPDASVRLHAIAALKQLAPETARDQLEQLLTREPLDRELRAGVAIALQEWSA
jgi:HEAT repeat protein